MDEMDATASLQQDMRFGVIAGSGHSVTVDMLDAQTQGTATSGFSPMELLLVALAGCTGISVLSVLRKRRQEITGYELQVHGVRVAQHPRVFSTITVHHVFSGNALDGRWIERAIALSEKQLCGVEAMLSKTASISHSYEIKDSVVENMG